MQDGRDNGGRVELQIGEDTRHFDGVRKIGVTARPHLAAVLLHRIDVSTIDQGLVRTRIVAQNAINQLVLP